jgi:ribosome-binding protein aMBF1 (putative translation factor)
MAARKTEFTPEACRAARRLLNWAQMTLAKASGVDVSIVIDFERERANVSPDAVSVISSALQEAGIRFATGEPRLKSKAENGMVGAPI